MAENKTKPTDVTVDQFLEGVAPETRRAESRTLIGMMRAATGEAPRMWGPSIIGFGKVAYTYDSGRTGEMPVISFSPRKAAIVLYVGSGLLQAGDLLPRLGKHSTGKGCLYVKRLGDVDPAVLRNLIEIRVAAVKAGAKT